MSDTTSGESQTSVEGGKPPSTTSSWPITDIGGSEAGEDQSTSVSPASSSLPSSPKLDEPASTETISSVVDPIDPIPETATELHGAGTSPEMTPSATTDEEAGVTESQALPVMKGEGAVSGEKQDPVDATDETATPQATAASGEDELENTTTSVASEADIYSRSRDDGAGDAAIDRRRQDKGTRQGGSFSRIYERPSDTY